MKPMEASELIGFWLISLGANIGTKQSSHTKTINAEFAKSIGRCEKAHGTKLGARIARAAATIRHHYKTWNLRQEPGMAKGAYQDGFIIDPTTKHRQIRVSYAEEDIAAEQW